MMMGSPLNKSMLERFGRLVARFGSCAVLALGCRPAVPADKDPSLPAAAAPAPQPTLNSRAAAACPALGKHDFAFTSNADGDAEIYLYRAQTRSIEQLTDNETQDHWASWSPDGSQLAFQSTRDGNREIYTLDLESGAVRNISSHPEQDLLPAWSPDGQSIAFQSSRDRPWSGQGPLGGNLYLVVPDGSELTPVATDSFLTTAHAVWAPDSKSIAYARFGEGAGGIYVFDLETSRETRLDLGLPVGAAPGMVAWSPSGDAIVYYLDHESGSDLFRFELSAGQTRRVTGGDGYHYYASWSAHGDLLLTTSAQDTSGQVYDIRCISLDGSVDVPVIDDASDARAAAWRPTAGLE